MKKILITDDAAFLRMALNKMLTQAGYSVYESASGEETLEKYKKLQPDLVTMDITMPGMDGITTLKELKKIDPDCKVIMCSAMGQQEKIVSAIQAGATDFIAKPFQESRVLAAVRKNIGV